MARRNSHISSRPAASGLSLVELMVALLLGLLLTSGIVAVYLESKRNFEAEDELARIQENGRYAVSLLKRELTLAGFFGGYLTLDNVTGAPTITNDCTSGGALAIDDNPVEWVNNYSGSVTNLAGCLPGSDVQPGTDVLTVKRTAGEPTVFAGATAAASVPSENQVYFRVDNFGDPKSWYFSGSDTGFPTTVVNDPNSASNETEYWEMYTRVFYIRKYSVVSGDGIPTLCVSELVGTSMSERCLVEGVEDMQIVFGVDTDTNPDTVPNRYVADPNDAGAEVAVTARVYLLLRSVGELTGTQHKSVKTYQLGPGTTYTRTDGYLRRLFSTTVQMRNAILPAAD